mmetsp:Transcript_42128/g.86080  ORF Transcript_42128/g.86080 Transcript_42128/m.86080 type:complete len:943 (-) Transcript_42128:131-2959(-)
MEIERSTSEGSSNSSKRRKSACEVVVFNSFIPEAPQEDHKEHFTFLDEDGQQTTGTESKDGCTSTAQPEEEEPVVKRKAEKTTPQRTKASAPPPPSATRTAPRNVAQEEAGASERTNGGENTHHSTKTRDEKTASQNSSDKSQVAKTTVAPTALKSSAPPTVAAQDQNKEISAKATENSVQPAVVQEQNKESSAKAEETTKSADDEDEQEIPKECNWSWKWAKNELDNAAMPESKKRELGRGCVLLRDAYDGRASHGLFSLLDGPAYKRILFKVQTAQWWQSTIIWTNLLHCSLIMFEAQNWRVSWEDPDLDPLWLKIVECLCIMVYAADVIMKMNYFGGWKDYVSKEWQRNYLTLIFCFFVDLTLYTFRLCPLRFSRPCRLFIFMGRHRDVRRLASFIPRMATKMFKTFALPLFLALSFFGILCTRLFGWMQNEGDYGKEHFPNIPRAIQSLFLLSTLDNYDPIVIDAFPLSRLSFVIYLAFIVSTAFFLMSMALGEVFDMYVEDNIATVTAEAKKESKSLDKAFKKLDVDQTKMISWPNFREMLHTLRPQDSDRRAWMIFKSITQDSGKPMIDRDLFLQIGEVLHVKFIFLHQKYTGSAIGGHSKWAKFQRHLITADCLAILFGIDGLLLTTVDLSWLISWMPALHLRVSFLLSFLSAGVILYIFVIDYAFFMRMSVHQWRRSDYAIIAVSVVACVLLLPCPGAWQPGNDNGSCFTCAVPWRQVILASDAARLTRIVLHSAEARLTLTSVTHVGPVMAHMGGLMLTITYFFGTSTMEMLAGKVCHAKQCARRMPNFDCASSAIISMFQLSIGSNWGDVLAAVDNSPNAADFSPTWRTGVSLWLTLAYIILGIGLTNLLTALMFEFHKMLREEEEEHKRVIAVTAQKRKMVFRRLLAALRLRKNFNLSLFHSDEVETEVMVGRVYGNWRRKLHSKSTEAAH